MLSGPSPSGITVLAGPEMQFAFGVTLMPVGSCLGPKARSS